MPLNPNILLQLEHPDVMGSYSKGYDRGRKLASEDATLKKSNVLSQAMSNPLQKNETYSQRLAPLGGLAEGQELDKNQAAISKDNMATKKAEIETNLQKVELEASANQSLLAVPPGTLNKQAVLQHFQGLVQQGTLGQEYLAKVQEKLATIPDDDAAIRSVAQGGVQAGMKAKDVLDKYLTDANARLQAETAKAGQDVTARGQDLSYGMDQQELGLKRQEQEFSQGQDVAKLSEAQKKQVIGVQNTKNAIQEYRDQLKGFGITDLASPDARAAMGTKYNNMMLQAKEAYNLGVLNDQDFEVLQKVITDPASWKGAITSNEALDSQAAELDRIMTQIQGVAGGDLGAPRQPKPITDQQINALAQQNGVSPDIVRAYLAKKGKM